MSFVVGLILYVVVAGLLDARIPWPRTGERSRP